MRDLKKVIKVNFRSVDQLKHKKQVKKKFSFPATEKRLDFNKKTYLKKLKLHFIFFRLISRFIAITAGKQSQHMAVSCILFKKEILEGI